MKKISAWMFVSILAIIIIVAGCSNNYDNGGSDQQPTASTTQEESNLNMEGYPIVKEPIKLTMMGAKSPMHGPWEDMLVLNRYQEKSNVQVTWETPPLDGYQEKKNLMFASGDALPDAFFGGNMTRNDELVYGSGGDALIPLNDLIDQYAPNFKALMEQFPDIKKTITLPDGNIYTLPRITGSLRTRTAGNNTYINKKWLDELQLPIPSTPEEFYQTLKAFKEQDPNKNGAADEIPMSGNTNYFKTLPIIMGAWGITSDYGLFDVKDGKVRFTPAAPEYKEALEFASKLFDEKLIAFEMITNTNPMYQAEGKTHPMGVITSSAFWSIAGDKWQDYVILPPLKGPNGDQVWPNFNPIVSAVGTFAITKENKNPEATMRWVDYWYGSEGAIALWGGYEGETYQNNADGTWSFLDVIVKNPDGLNRNEALGRISPWQGLQLPTAGTKEYEEHVGKQVFTEQQKTHENSGTLLANYAPEVIMPIALPFTEEEQQRVTVLQTDIATYVDQMKAKFITKEESFDNWDKYVSQLDKMGYKELTELTQKAMER